MFAADGKAFGRAIGQFQGMRWKAADMMIQIEAGRGLLYRAAVSGKQFPDPTLAAMAKIYCNEMSIRVTSEAVQVHGGYGFTDAFPVSRFYRGARYGTLGGGASETLRDLIGKRIVAGQDDIDAAVKYGFGLRYLAAGPVLQKDLAGLDIHFAAATSVL